MKAAIVALTALLTSCFFPQEDCLNSAGVAVLNASPKWSVEEQTHLQNAANRWNAFAKREVIAVRPNTSGPTCTIFEEQPPPPAIGYFKGRSGNILIAPLYSCASPLGKDMACFEAIAMHEMGHLLGLGHLPEGEDGIMRATTGALDFSDADHEACVNSGICVGAVK